MHLLNSLGSILARCYFRGAHMPHHATNNVRILPGTHLYTWVESSNVDKVSCWRTKSARHGWELNPEPFDPESRVQSNIPRHLHIKGDVFPNNVDWVSWKQTRPTVKFWANFNNQFKTTSYVKFCMPPSLDGTVPECVIPQENNSPLTLYIYM